MAKITGREYVQYLTEQFLGYIETPAEDRKNAKKTAKASKELWLIRWFGAGGASLYFWFNKRNNDNSNNVNATLDHHEKIVND